MPDLATIKIIHVSSAALSIGGFLLRGGLMLSDSALMRRRWMRIWPHFIDSALLLSGVWMAIVLHLHPVNSPWLGAKLLALLAYIGLGFVALRLGKTRRARALAFVAALACFVYIALAAVRHSPLPV